MSRSQETIGKKEVRNKKEKKRKEKAQKRAKKKSEGKNSSFDDMIAYVDEFGMISSTPPDPDKKTVIIAEDIELKVTKNKPENTPDFVRKGVVSFYNESKGFGFIRDLESNQRVFVHANNLMEPIKENNVVIFEIGKGPKGPSALKVRLFKE
ncbi:MAG: DNA-binding protein [Bacteroidetes bacterium RBG_19FT_COMBO_42_7]|jgi:cold shock CspA family protein|nr:MAG: DNA-binding protein [Bacteroidetes bacterium RBG_13_42_15]OFY78111.1 MAG: DNA-binding protein [Bacteroidetes bacterium RBG_19FT_COMBO_42_7]